MIPGHRQIHGPRRDTRMSSSFPTAYIRLTWWFAANWRGVEGSELTPTSVVAGSEVMAVVSRENATEPDCDTEESMWDVEVLRASTFTAHV
jgi:hypothetical protein